VITLNIGKDLNLIKPDIPVLLFFNPSPSVSFSAASALDKIDGK
jgi:hypothetical protein